MFARLKDRVFKPAIGIFSIALFLLPVIIINLGYRLDLSRRQKFEAIERNNLAQNKLEAMIRAGDSEDFIKKTAAAVKTSLKNNFSRHSAQLVIDQEINAAKRGKRISSQLFLLTTRAGKSDLPGYKPEEGFGKAQLTNIFQLLLSLSEGDKMSPAKEKISRKMFAHLFGQRMIPEDLARLFKGRPYPAIIAQRPVYFVWDYWKSEDGTVHAFFWLLDNSRDLETLVLGKAVTGSAIKQAGFVRLFRNDESDLLTRNLAKNRHFALIRGELKDGLKSYLNLGSKGLPNAIKLGRHIFYSRQIPDRKWLGIISIPVNKENTLPVWLFMVNLVAFITFCLLTSKRLIFGYWPQLSLRSRFLAVIGFAVLIPIALSGSISHFYCESWLRAESYRVGNETKSCILKLELQQQSIESKYLKRFNDLLENKQSKEIFANWHNQPEKLLDGVARHFQSQDEPLPLTGIFVINLNGEKISRTFSRTLELSMNYISSFCHSPFFENLRSAMTRKNPDFELPQAELSSDLKTYPVVYEMVMNRDFEQELDKRRGEAIWFDSGNERFGYLQNYYLQNDTGFSLQVFFSLKNTYEIVFTRALEGLTNDYPQALNAVYIAPTRETDEKWIFSKNCDENTQKYLKQKILSAEKSRTEIHETDSSKVLQIEISKNFPGVFFGSYTPTGKIYQAYRELRFRSFYIMAFCFMVAIFLAFVLYYRIISPINLTTRVVERISREDFAAEPRLLERSDEFGILGQEIANMLTGLRERKQLASVLSDQAIEALQTSENEKNPEKCRFFKGVALVTDIRSFTSISESFPPEQITSMLNTHFAEMAAAITSENGKIYKFIGDAIEAIFEVEAEESIEQTADRAARAGTKMLSRLEKILVRRKEIGLFHYRIGIGLEVGSFTAGIVGDSSSRLDYAILGTPLKTAANLEALSRNSSTSLIICSNEVKAMLEPQQYLFEKIDGEKEIAYSIVASQKISEKNLASGSASPEKSDRQSFLSLSQKFFRQAFFIIGLAIMVFASLNLQSLFLHLAESRRQEILNGAQKNAQALSELLQHENAGQFLAESFLCRQADKIGNDLAAVSNHELSQYKKEITASFSDHGSKFEKLLLCRAQKDQVQPFLSQNFSRESLRELQPLLLKLNRQSRNFADQTSSFDFVSQERNSHLESLLEKHFGLRSDMSFLNDEMVFRTFLFTRDNREKFFFWAPLFQIDADVFEPKTSLGAHTLFEFPQRRQWQHTGLMLARFSLDECIVSALREAQTLSKSLGLWLEIRNKVGIQPNKLKTRKISPGEKSILRQNFKLGNNSWQAEFFYRDEAASWKIPLLIANWLVFAIFVLIFFLSVFRHQGFATSLRKQLSIAILIGILVPTSFVLLTVERFQTIELQNLRQEEIQKINSRLEEIERMQYLFQPYLADHLEKISGNAILQQLVSEKSPEAQVKISKYLSRRINELENEGPAPLEVGQAVILRRDGVCIAAETDQAQTSSSNSIAEGVSRIIFDSLIRGELPNPVPLAQRAKDEMILEAFIHVYRSIFGEAILARLFSSPGMPVIQNAISSCATVMCIPTPKVSPNYLSVWTTVLTDQRAMLRAAATRQANDIPVFAEVQIKLGHSSFPNRKRRAKLSEKILRWVGHTGQHLEFVLPQGEDELLAVGQIGRIHPKTLLVAFSSLTKLKRELQDSILSALLILGLGIVIAYIMIMTIAQNLIEPVRAMIFQTRSLREQSYSKEITSVFEDELSLLCLSFNRMSRMIQEKALLKSLVSQQAASLLADAEHHEKARQGLKIQRIVAFINIAQDIAEMNEASFHAFSHQIGRICSAVSECGGDIDKIIGNKMLIFFPKKPNEAVTGLIRLIECLEILEKECKTRIFLGAHAGEVIAGMLGIGDQCDFTMIGDSVNTAARIQAAAQSRAQDSALISFSIVKLLPERIMKQKVCSITLKGKKDTFDLYSIH